jgi:L-lactate dehydrogenase
VSHWVENLQCCISLPAVLGTGGVLQTIDLPLSGEEKVEMMKSAERIKECVCEVENRYHE